MYPSVSYGGRWKRISPRLRRGYPASLHTGEIFKTVPHELARRLAASFRVAFAPPDVWSAGVMAYQLLAGQFPFDDWKNRSAPALSLVWCGGLVVLEGL